MPESKVRKAAAPKKSSNKQATKSPKAKQKPLWLSRLTDTRDWVPWVFVPTGLAGVLWLLVYYVAGSKIGFMVTLGNWNFLIGMGLIAACFLIATLWK